MANLKCNLGLAKGGAGEKNGEERVIAILMSLVCSLVPFGVFYCFSGFLTLKPDR